MIHGVWAVRMCCTAYVRAFVTQRMEGIPHYPDNADIRMPRHTQTAEHGTAQARSSEIQSAAYATAYVVQQIQGVPPHLGTEMQTCVCHGIQDGAETGTAIQIQQSRLPRTQPRTRIFADNARGGSPHVQGFRLFGRPASTGLSLPIQAFTPIPANTSAYLRAPVCQMRSR